MRGEGGKKPAEQRSGAKPSREGQQQQARQAQGAERTVCLGPWPGGAVRSEGLGARAGRRVH